MTQINRRTNPGLSSGASAYPAGFSHTNLKIRQVVFRASSLFLSVAGRDYVTLLKSSTHLWDELLLPREAKGERRGSGLDLNRCWRCSTNNIFFFPARFSSSCFLLLPLFDTPPNTESRKEQSLWRWKQKPSGKDVDEVRGGGAGRCDSVNIARRAGFNSHLVALWTGGSVIGCSDGSGGDAPLGAGAKAHNSSVHYWAAAAAAVKAVAATAAAVAAAAACSAHTGSVASDLLLLFNHCQMWCGGQCMWTHLINRNNLILISCLLKIPK